MEYAEITEKVLEKVKERFGEEKVFADTDFEKDLHADVLDMVELVMCLEEHFGIEIMDEDADKFETVGDIIMYVHQKLHPEEQRKFAEKTFNLKWENGFWAFGKKELTRIVSNHYKAPDKGMKEAPKFSVEEISIEKIMEAKQKIIFETVNKRASLDSLRDNFAHLVEEYFPKHKCQERGKALVLFAELMIGISKYILTGKVPKTNSVLCKHCHNPLPLWNRSGYCEACDKKICKHCNHPITIRNPSGHCDHLHYPDNCETCKNSLKPKPVDLPEEIDPTGYKVDDLYMKIILAVNKILNYLKKRDKK